MSREEIEALNDDYLLEAAFVPHASMLATEIFSFLHTNAQHCLIPAQFGIMGIDKDKLERLAERRGIELARYDVFVELYIEKAVKWHNQQLSPSN